MTDVPPPPPPNPSFPQPGANPWQQAPGPYGGPAFQQAPPPGRSGKAVAALVLGIAGIVLCFLGLVSILALVFGILALREISRSAGARTGKGMAVAGVVLGAVGLVAGVALVALVVREIAGTTSVADLRVGDCVELPEEGEEIARIETFDCDEPHPAEVIAVTDLREGDEAYPGDDEVFERVQEDCLREFEDYIGLPYRDSVFEVFPITPLEDGWDDDSTYICLAFEPDEDLVGSIEGANR